MQMSPVLRGNLSVLLNILKTTTAGLQTAPANCLVYEMHIIIDNEKSMNPYMIFNSTRPALDFSHAKFKLQQVKNIVPKNQKKTITKRCSCLSRIRFLAFLNRQFCIPALLALEVSLISDYTLYCHAMLTGPKRVTDYIRYQEMQLKSYKRAGCTTVWSNSKRHSELLLSTSANRANDNIFDLQILEVDLADKCKDLNLTGRAMYNSPFRCLAWGTFGEKDQTLPYGLLFGGMENGSFTLWNVAQIVGSYDEIDIEQIEEQKSFLYAEEAEEEETCPILCAEWNELKNNFLAFGSTNLLLLDVGKDVTSPEILKPSQKNPHEGSHISSVSWNKQVPYILASAGSDGLIALWDIKTNKSIFQFKDSGPSIAYRQVEIAWSKHISTQIAVTLDDEKKNQLQIWDLRRQKGPIVVIDKIHTKGINSIDWSQLDYDLILASSRDRKVVCWNYKQDEQPLNCCKLNSDINKVSWSKNLSSVYSITTNDSIQIYTLDDRNLLSYVPKWLKVPIGTTFNGNSSFLLHSEDQPNLMNEYRIEVTPKQMLRDDIISLQTYLQNGSEQFTKSENADELWKLILTKINMDSDCDIYEFLGLKKDKIVKEVEKYTGKKRKSLENTAKNRKVKAGYIPVQGNDAANFFSTLGLDTTNQSKENDDDGDQDNIKYDMVARNPNWDIGKQKIIKQNMLIGNYEGAIDAALKCGRTAQALIIAYSLDQNTFNNTLKTFFTETTDHFISGVLKHIAFKDTEELVAKYDLGQWKECIALIYSLSSSEKRKGLLKCLADRIVEEEDSEQLEQAAIYCYILADNFEEIVNKYIQKIEASIPNSYQRKKNVLYYGLRLIAIFESLKVNALQPLQYEKILREMAMICVQAGKNMLAYQILTKYLEPKSTLREIRYLINSTEQLSEYKNMSQLHVINLPTMLKKQVESKPKTNKGNMEKPLVPQNMKPNHPKNMVKVPDLHQSQQYEQAEHAHDTVEGYKEAARKRNQPPPPPSSRQRPVTIPTFGGEEDEEDDQGRNHLNPPPFQKKSGGIPPPPPKSGGVPPPPKSGTATPPPKSGGLLPPPKPLRNQNDQSFANESTRNVPPPAPKKTHTHTPPPPPSVHQQMQNSQKSERGSNQHIAPPPPTRGQRTQPPAPPKRQIAQEQPYPASTPPSTQKKKPPNRPQLPSHNVPANNRRVPPSRQPAPYIDQQADEDDDFEYEQEQSQHRQPLQRQPVRPQRQNQIKQQQQYEQHTEGYSQQQRRPLPRPAQQQSSARKGVPPPSKVRKTEPQKNDDFQLPYQPERDKAPKGRAPPPSVPSSRHGPPPPPYRR